MCRRVLFYLEWRVTDYGGRTPMVIWFPSLFSLSWYVMYIIVLFVFYFLILVCILLICSFIPFSFIEIFILFNLVLQLQFLICLVFHFGYNFLKFLILSLALLLKFFFQFHHSINFFIIDFFQFHHSFTSTVLQFN
jgi:hypothetical protein